MGAPDSARRMSNISSGCDHCTSQPASAVRGRSACSAFVRRRRERHTTLPACAWRHPAFRLRTSSGHSCRVFLWLKVCMLAPLAACPLHQCLWQQPLSQSAPSPLSVRGSARTAAIARRRPARPPLRCPESANGLFEFAREVMSGPEYQAAEAERVQARQRLEAAVPAFAPGAPGFNWIKAWDVVSCLGVQGDWHFMREMGVGSAGDVENVWAPIAQHMLWRLLTLYAAPGAPRISIAAALQLILSHMAAEAPGEGGVPVLCLSGHDVTLLPLLGVLADAPAKAWPDFASAVVMERWSGEGGDTLTYKWMNDALLRQSMETHPEATALPSQGAAAWLLPSATTGRYFLPALTLDSDAEQDVRTLRDGVKEAVQGGAGAFLASLYPAAEDAAFMSHVAGSAAPAPHVGHTHASYGGSMPWSAFTAAVQAAESR